MTDIPRGQGGDGSPQLDLDAIADCLPHNPTERAADITEIEAVAMYRELRRLQQENEELRADRDLWRESTRNAGRLLARVDPEKEGE